MRTIVCMLLVMGAASAQHADTTTTADANIDLQTIINSVSESATAATGAATQTAGAAATAGGGAASTTRGAATAAAAAATGLANRGTIGLNLGPAFYGPGLNNANAIRPNQHAVSIYQNYLKTAPNAANLRVFVSADGMLHFTDQFGQEFEVADPHVAELLEIANEPFEVQERVTELRSQALEQAILTCETQLRQKYFNDPASFTPAIVKGVTFPAVGGAAGAGATVGARAVVA